MYKHNDRPEEILEITSKTFVFSDSAQFHSILESGHEFLAPKRFYYTDTMMVNFMCRLEQAMAPFCLVKHQ